MSTCSCSHSATPPSQSCCSPSRLTCSSRASSTTAPLPAAPSAACCSRTAIRRLRTGPSHKVIEPRRPSAHLLAHQPWSLTIVWQGDECVGREHDRMASGSVHRGRHARRAAVEYARGQAACERARCRARATWTCAAPAWRRGQAPWVRVPYKAVRLERGRVRLPPPGRPDETWAGSRL
jgi:hypothetical protein